MRHDQTLRSFASLLAVERAFRDPTSAPRPDPSADDGGATDVGPPPDGGWCPAPDPPARSGTPSPGPDDIGSSPALRGFLSSYGCGSGAALSLPSLSASAADGGGASGGETRRGGGGGGGGGPAGDSLPTHLLRAFLARGNPFPAPPGSGASGKGKKKLRRRGSLASADASDGEGDGGGSGGGRGPASAAAPAAAAVADEKEEADEMEDDDDGGPSAAPAAPPSGPPTPAELMAESVHYTTDPGRRSRFPPAGIDSASDAAAAPHAANRNVAGTVRGMIDARVRRYLSNLVRRSVVRNEGRVTEGCARALAHDVGMRDVDPKEEKEGGGRTLERRAERLEDKVGSLLEDDEEGGGAQRTEMDGGRQESGEDSASTEKEPNDEAGSPGRSSSFRCFRGGPLGVSRDLGVSWLKNTQTARVTPTNHRVSVSMVSCATSFNVPRDAEGAQSKHRVQGHHWQPPQDRQRRRNWDAHPTSSIACAPSPPPSSGVNPSDKTTSTTMVTKVSLPLTFATVVTVELGGRGSGCRCDLEFGTGGKIVGTFCGPSLNPLLVAVDITLDTDSLYQSMVQQVKLAVRQAVTTVLRSTPSLQGQCPDRRARSIRRSSLLSSRGPPPGQEPQRCLRRVFLSSTGGIGGSSRSLGSAFGDRGDAQHLPPSEDALVSMASLLSSDPRDVQRLGGEGACPRAAQAAEMLRRASLASAASSVGGSDWSPLGGLGDEDPGDGGGWGGGGGGRRRSSTASVASDLSVSRRISAMCMGPASRRGSTASRRGSMESVGSEAANRRGSIASSAGESVRLSGSRRGSLAHFTSSAVEKRPRLSNETERRRASMEHARRLSVGPGAEQTEALQPTSPGPPGEMAGLDIPTCLDVMGGGGGGTAPWQDSASSFAADSADSSHQGSDRRFSMVLDEIVPPPGHAQRRISSESFGFAQLDFSDESFHQLMGDPASRPAPTSAAATAAAALMPTALGPGARRLSGGGPLSAAAAARRLSAGLSRAGGGSMASTAAAVQFQLRELEQLEEMQVMQAAAAAQQGAAARMNHHAVMGQAAAARRESFQGGGSFQRRMSLDRELLGPILSDLAEGGAAGQGAAAVGMVGQMRMGDVSGFGLF